MNKTTLTMWGSLGLNAAFVFMLWGAVGTGNDLATDLVACNTQVSGMLDKRDSTSQSVEDITKYIIKLRRGRFNPYVAELYAREFVNSAELYNFNPKFLVALSIIESGVVQRTEYGVTLTSAAGAQGIMQVMPRYWGYGAIPFIKKPNDLKHSVLNIRAGAHVLHYYREMYNGDIHKALLAYNRGERAVNRDIRKGRNPSNGYAHRVWQRAKQFTNHIEL